MWNLQFTYRELFGGLLIALAVISFFKYVAFEPWPASKEPDVEPQILTVEERSVIQKALKSLRTMAYEESLKAEIDALLPRLDDLCWSTAPLSESERNTVEDIRTTARGLL